MAASSTSFSLTTSNLHQLIVVVSVKLNSTNYLIWRMQIFPLIQSLKLIKHITNDVPATTKIAESGEKVPEPTFESWQQTDLLLRSWITGTLSEEALGHVVGLNTAHEIWMCLEEKYLQATKERELQLRRQLQMPKKENISLDNYLRNFKSIFDNLAAIQKLVSDEDKTIQLSHCLGTKYDVFVTTMLSKPPFPTFAQFVTALQNYSMRFEVTDTNDKGVPNQNQNLAFVTYRGGGRGRGRGCNSGPQFNSRGRGFAPANNHYSSRGHHQAQQQYFQVKQQPPQAQQQYFQVKPTAPAQNSELTPHSRAQQQHSNQAATCQIGHTTPKCWYRFDYAYETNENLSQALACTTLSSFQNHDSNWYTDTCATSYMTSTEGNLHSSFPYNGHDFVVVGDGSRLPISHVGHTTLSSKYGDLALHDVLVVPELKKNLISVGKLT